MFIHFIIIICILFNFIKNINAISCSISANEYNALYNFYTSTNGIYWKNKQKKWIFPSDLNQQCDTTTSLWYGVTCIEIIPGSGICNIVTITLAFNNLQGSISKDIANFQNLINLKLENNTLSGTIPSELGNLVQLTTLQLYDNKLSGTIPSELGNLVHLTTLQSNSNQLSGTIPSELGNLVRLTYLSLDSNQLNGSIPSELGNLVQLTFVYLESNQLNGSIPSELGNLFRLTYLELYDNQLSGSIPSELGNIVHLNYFQLFNNQLSGTIPLELGNLVLLTNFYLFNNTLSGTIPSELGNLVQLVGLYLANNQLSGTIPSELGNLVQLTSVYLESNQLNGSIPLELGNLVQLIGLYLDSNQLSGSIPSELGNLFRLTYLELYDNQLSGSIPVELGNLTSLSFLDFSSNSLTGSIPKNFNQLHQLKALFLTNNSLTGTLDAIFNSYAQSKLINIDLVNNILSGTIPSYIFAISSLETFAISNNCMKGSLPKEICSSITLNSLILDGLHSKCGTRIFPSYLPINTFHATSDVIIGGIPICVFNMINLTTLHVSGNSIQGSLDNDIALSNTLINIDISTNLYNGKIPNTIQNKQWQYLNLGFNKFKDTIIDTFPIQRNSSNTLNLTLVNNRISGLIPSSLDSYSNISILEGNIFSCSSIFSSHNILPKNDPLSSLHQCGTNYLYQIILIFCIITIIIILINLRFYKDSDNKFQNLWYKNIDRLRIIGKEIQTLLFFSSSSLSFVYKEYDNNDDIMRITDGLSYVQDSNITLLLIISENLQQCLIYNIVFITCVLLLSSIILHQYYSTYDFMYGYNLSMTFLSGYSSANIIILLIIISIIFIYHIININCFHLIVNDIVDDDKNIKKSVNNKISKSNHFWRFLILFIINLIMMIVINGLYVIASLNPEKYPHIQVYAILVSIIKSVWKSWILPFILSVLIIDDNDNDNENDWMKSMNKNINIKLNIIFLCTLGIMNIIVIPLLTTSLLSTSCFYYALIPQPLISSSYSFQVCMYEGGTNGVCLNSEYISRISSYQPPFQYSYQCSSALMTTYDYVYITMSILLILESLLVSFIKFCYNKIKGYERIEKIMNKVIPSKFKPLTGSLKNGIKKDEEINKEEKEGNMVLKCYKNSRNKKNKVILFNQTQYIVDIVTFMTLSVTIGFILPLVGIIICISLYLYIHCVLSSIGGKLKNATIEDKKILEKECENFVDNLNINMNKCIFPIMGLFFPLFVFDIVGDVEGSDVAFKYLIFTILIPFILWLIKYIYTLYSNNITNKLTKKEEHDENEISLQNIRKTEVNNPLNIRIE